MNRDALTTSSEFRKNYTNRLNCLIFSTVFRSVLDRVFGLSCGCFSFNQSFILLLYRTNCFRIVIGSVGEPAPKRIEMAISTMARDTDPYTQYKWDFALSHREPLTLHYARGNEKATFCARKKRYPRRDLIEFSICLINHLTLRQDASAMC